MYLSPHQHLLCRESLADDVHEKPPSDVRPVTSEAMFTTFQAGWQTIIAVSSPAVRRKPCRLQT